MLASSADTIDTFNTGFDTVNLQRPTVHPGHSEKQKQQQRERESAGDGHHRARPRRRRQRPCAAAGAGRTEEVEQHDTAG